MKGLPFFKAVLVCVSLIFVSQNVFALNVQKFRPVSTGHTDGFLLHTSQTLPKYYFTGGLSLNYAHHPFEQTTLVGLTRIAGIVDQFVTMDLSLNYGLTDWLTVNANLPVNIYHNIAPTFIAARDKAGGDIGDISLQLKFQLFDAEKTASHLGLAVVPFAYFPSGENDVYFGDLGVKAGFLLVGDALIKDNRFYVNVGPSFRKREQIANLIVDHELLYGVGFQRPLVRDWDLDIIAEIMGSTNFRKFAVEDISSPLEATATLQKKWLEGKNLITHFGGGAGLTNGYGLPVFRVFAGISYGGSLKNAQLPKRRLAIISDKVLFDFDKYNLKPGADEVLDKFVPEMSRYNSILIEGHTDHIGTEEYNQNLSVKRAQTVRGYFTTKGIDESKIDSKGHGETKPISTNDTAEGRALNRRVEIWMNR